MSLHCTKALSETLEASRASGAGDFVVMSLSAIEHASAQGELLGLVLLAMCSHTASRAPLW